MNVSRNGNIILIGMLTMTSKLVAVFRQIILTYFYGATSISDAYILAQSIPNVLFMLVMSAIGITFIPVYSQITSEHGNKDAEYYTTRMLNAVFLIASTIVILTLIFTKQVVFIFASGFNEETAAIVIKFVRISIFSIYFLGAVGIFSAYLKANKQYFSPAVIGISLSIVEIISCIVAAKFGDVYLAVGITIATFSQFLIVFVSALRHGYRWQKGLSIIDPYLKKVLLISIPILVSFGTDEINVIIDKTIASRFDAGSISALNYSNSIVSIIHNVITVSIYTVIFSDVSKLAAVDDRKKITEQIQNALHSACLLLIPALLGLIVFSKPIVQILFERGSFTHAATLITSGTMVFYALSILPNGIRMLSQTYFYSYGKTKFCMFVGIAAVIINIVLNIILSHFIGIYGLALASSIAIMVAAIFHLIKFCQDNKDFKKKLFLRNGVIMAINSALMGVMSYVVYSVLNSVCNYIIAFVVAIFVAIFSYFGLSIITHTLDMTMLKNLMHKRG